MNDKPKLDNNLHVLNLHVLHVRKIGNSTGVILPKELLARLGLKEGDKLTITELSEKGLKLSQFDPHHAETMAVAREILDDYKDTFRELAK